MSGWYEDQERRYLNMIQDNWERLKNGTAYLVVKENTDKTEGRGPMKVVGRYRDPWTAYKAREGKGIMGRDRQWPYMDTHVEIVNMDKLEGLPIDDNTFEEFLEDAIPDNHPCAYRKAGADSEYEQYLALKKKFEG